MLVSFGLVTLVSALVARVVTAADGVPKYCIGSSLDTVSGTVCILILYLKVGLGNYTVGIAQCNARAFNNVVLLLLFVDHSLEILHW